MCDLPHVPHPSISLFAGQAIRTSRIRQGGLQKLEKQMMFYLLPKARPTFVSGTHSGTMTDRLYLKADIFVL